jgi:DNA-binding transcriptional LysR family regulator
VRRHGPDQAVEVVHLPLLEQVRRLHDGELDLAIFPGAESPEGLELQPLFAGEELAAFMSRDHPLAVSDVVTPAELHSETLVVVPRSTSPALHDRLMGLLSDAGYEFESIYEVSGASARDLLLAVASGLGVALAPVSTRQTSGVGGIVVQRLLEPPVPAPDIVLAWSAKPHGSVRALVDVLREVARTLHSGDLAMIGGV